MALAPRFGLNLAPAQERKAALLTRRAAAATVVMCPARRQTPGGEGMTAMPAVTDRPGRPSALGAAFVLAGLAMIPWACCLWITLPASARDAHWALAWAGLDGCEALALSATGRFLLRRDNRCVLTAAGTAVLLLADAWFDVTSASGPDLATAIVMAVFAEIPVALACAVLAARVLRTPFPRG